MNQHLHAAGLALLTRYRDHNPGGFTPTDLEDVEFFSTSKPTPLEALSYDPGLAIILAGKKIGHLDGRRFEYGEGTYLVVGMPLVFECESYASEDEPLFGLFLRFRKSDLQDLANVLEVDGAPRVPKEPSLGVEPLPVTSAMRDALLRLVRQLCRPHEAAALGQNTLREIFFHALQDAHGRVLLSLTQVSRPEARIAELLSQLDARGGAGAFSVNSLAQEAGMSPATLHRHFKCVTGYSPVQYFKRRRLMQAKSLLAVNMTSVAEAADAVGYTSTAQFSRDFKSFFGTPPSQVRQR